jgi:hypothetical protein
MTMKDLASCSNLRCNPYQEEPSWVAIAEGWRKVLVGCEKKNIFEEFLLFFGGTGV